MFTPETTSSAAAPAAAIPPGDDAPGASQQTQAQSVIRGAGLAAALQVGAAGLLLVLQIVLARQLGPAEFGAYSYWTAWALMLFPMAALGLPEAGLRLTAAYAATGAWEELRGFVIRGSQLVLSAALALSLLTLVLAGWLSLRSSTSLTWAALGLSLVPALALTSLWSAVLRASGRIGRSLAPTIIGQPLLLLAAVLAWRQLLGPLSATIVLALNAGAAAAILAVQGWLLRRAPAGPAGRVAPKYLTARWLGLAVAFLIAGGCSAILRQSDVILLGLMQGERAAGLYQAAVRIASLIGLSLWGVNMVAAPRIAALYATREIAVVQRFVTLAAHLALWPALAATAVVGLMPRFILGIFGAEFIQMQPALLILAAGQLLNAAAGPTGVVLSMTGHQTLVVRVLAVTTLLHIGLCWAAVRWFGAPGAAAAASFSAVVWNVWMHRLARKQVGLTPSVPGAWLFARAP